MDYSYIFTTAGLTPRSNRTPFVRQILQFAAGDKNRKRDASKVSGRSYC